ncbi:hypothetical protein [Helicobacter sp. T3_23-1056]
MSLDFGCKNFIGILLQILLVGLFAFCVVGCKQLVDDTEENKTCKQSCWDRYFSQYSGSAWETASQINSCTLRECGCYYYSCKDE